MTVAPLSVSENHTSYCVNGTYKNENLMLTSFLSDSSQTWMKRCLFQFFWTHMDKICLTGQNKWKGKMSLWNTKSTTAPPQSKVKVTMRSTLMSSDTGWPKDRQTDGQTQIWNSIHHIPYCEHKMLITL